jgi:hypothetical protein
LLPAALTLAPALALAMMLAGCARAADPPSPPAPDYAQPAAWAAWPGRASGADSVPPGLDHAASGEQKADTFFIHPTTYLSGPAANARYDEPDATSERIDRGVLRFQASAFNACCRIYAPHYRQAAISAFQHDNDAKAQAAFELAYGDVQRAFDYYMAHENHGRPFILASHSQGSLHAMRLLQERIARQPAQRLLVAAYIVGYPLPEELAAAGVPVCTSAAETGCFVDWNTVKTGTHEDSRQESRLVWLDGRYQHIDGRSRVCVNPLDWRVGGEAPAAANLGSLPGAAGAELPAPVPQLTGARCQDALLEVAIPWSKSRGFVNLLTLFGSYHILDYNLFYTNIRINAGQRVAAWRAAHPN